MSALGSLVVKLALEYAQYTQGLDKGGQQALAYGKRVQAAADQAARAMDSAKQRVVSSVTAIGSSLVAGISVGAFATLIKGAIDTGDELNKLAQKTGMSTESLSQWRYAAKLNDVTNESLNTGIRKLNISIAEGLAGDKQKLALFKALGITQADLGKGTESVMFQMADAYAGAADGAGKVAVGNGLMGKTADEMIPLLNGGSQAIKGLMTEANRLGLTISGDFAKRAEEFNDNLTRMKTAGEGAAIAMGGDLVTGLGSAMNAMAQAAIEGGKLAGVAAFLQGLFGGDDRHKANVAIVDLTDQILGTQNALDKARARGDAAESARLQKRLAALDKEITMHRNYAAMLDGDAEKAKAAAAKAAAAAGKKPDIKVPVGAAAAASEYDNLIKRVNERINLSRKEQEASRGLTEEEKFAVKVLHDLGELKKDATPKQIAYAKSLLQESAAAFEANAARDRSIKLLQSEEAQRGQWADEITAAYNAEQAAIAGARSEMDDYLRAINEENELTAFEIDLLGRSAETRERALDHFRVELDLRRKIRAIEMLKLPAPNEAELKDRARSGAVNQHAGVDAKAELKTLQEIEAYLDPSKAEAFGDALRAAFAGAGSAMTGLANAFGAYAQKQEEHAKQVAKAALLPAGEKRIKAEIDLAKKQATIQIGAYAEMAGAAKGFFKQNTAGYKVLDAVEKGFHAWKMISTATELAAKMGLISATTAAAITGNQGVASSAVTSAATAVPAQMAIAKASAVGAVANQGNGDPYSAFFRIAAMTAIMAALGLSVGGGGGGGGSGGPSAADRQKAAGTGTVLGDDAAKSASIANSLDALQDSAKIELKYQSGMLAALRNIESSMGGLSNLVIRTSGLTGEYQGPSQLGGRTTSNGGRILPGHSVLEKLWGSTSVSLRDQGIEFASQALADIIKDGGSIVAQAFAEIETVKKSWFGLSKKVTVSTEYSALDQEIIDQFTAVVDNIVGTTQLATSALGQSAAEYDAAIANVMVNLGKVSFKDMTGEEIQEQLTNIFSALGDDVARAAMPSTVAFQKVGEGLFETIIRVAGGVETAAYELEQLGITAVAYTEVLNKQGDVGAEIVRQSIMATESLAGVSEMIRTLDGSAEDLADTYGVLLGVTSQLVAAGISTEALTRTLVRGAGGLDGLQAGLDAYFEGALSDTDRVAAKTREMRRQFADLGLAMPASIVLFRSLVEGIDETTDAGQLLLGQVLKLAPAFDEATQAAADLASTILSARSDVQAAKDALRSYGEQLQSTSDGIVQQINTLRGQAAQALASAQATAQQNLSAIMSADQQAQQALASSRAALTGALQGVTSAIADAANQVLSAQQSVAQARAGITEGYLAALDQQASAREAITSAHLAAQSELLDAQQRLTDVQEQGAQALRAAGNDILQVLRELAGTSAGTGSLVEQYRAQRDAFDDLVARAKGGDLEAAQQVGGAGKSLITARRASANTREQVVAEDIYVRQQLAGVLAVTGSGQAPNTGPADDVAKAQAALATATEKAAAAQLLAVQSGASLTAVTTDLAAQYAAATAEVARWSSAVSASGASRTAEQVNILGAYNTALANLATAQSSQAALLAATQGLDLSGSQQSANAWSSAVDAAVLAQASYTSAQAAAATTSTDLQAALAAAAAAGLTLAAVKSPLDVFLESVVAFTDAQAVAAAVNADLYDGSADLVAQYESQVTAAAAATAALGAFQVRVAGIDLSALDQLSQLDGLMADYNAAIAALDALDPRTSVYGRQVTAAYEDILGRAPDAEGLNYWIDQLINGDSDERMRERITASATYMASPEWAAQNPGAPQYGTPEWQAIYGGYLNPHAAGLDRVPYDNYPAMLHVDETVLNRDAAAAWRASRTAPAGTAASGLSADELRSQHADFRRMMLEVIKRVQNVDLRLKKFDEDGIAERV